MPTIRTSGNGVGGNGRGEVYIPPNVLVLQPGAQVTNGSYIVLNVGDPIPGGVPGIFQCGGGGLAATEDGTTVRPVTIGPNIGIPTQAAYGAVTGTSANGVNSDGNAEIYEPPNVRVIQPGVQVTYGASRTLDTDDALTPVVGVWEITTGGLAASQNLTPVRTVTITPLVE